MVLDPLTTLQTEVAILQIFNLLLELFPAFDWSKALYRMGRDPQPQELTIAKGVRQGEDHEGGQCRAAAFNDEGALGNGFIRADRPHARREADPPTPPRVPIAARDSVRASPGCLANRALTALRSWPRRFMPVASAHAWSSGERSKPPTRRAAIGARTIGGGRSADSAIAGRAWR